LGGALGGVAGSLFDGKSGGSRAAGKAADAQVALGREIMGRGTEMTAPWLSTGQAANTQIGNLLGIGEDNFDWSGTPAYARMGVAALTDPSNPFDASNFIDGLEPGQQAFDYDRTLGQYDGSNAAAMNGLILDDTMNSYFNSVAGGVHSGKALRGAMQTAALTNAQLAQQWANQQLQSDMSSVTTGRAGVVQDLNRRQTQFQNLDAQSARGLNSVGTALTGAVAGARHVANGYAQQAAAAQQADAQIQQGIGNVLGASYNALGRGNGFLSGAFGGSGGGAGNSSMGWLTSVSSGSGNPAWANAAFGW
jgi:hypothetical protein